MNEFERIGHRQGGPLLAGADRQSVRAAQELALQPVDEQGLVGIICHRGDRCREQLRKRLGEPALADQPELGQHPVEPAAGLGRDAPGAVQGALVDRSAVEKREAELRERLLGIHRGRGESRLEGHRNVSSWRAPALDF